MLEAEPSYTPPKCTIIESLMRSRHLVLVAGKEFVGPNTSPKGPSTQLYKVSTQNQTYCS